MSEGSLERAKLNFKHGLVGLGILIFIFLAIVAWGPLLWFLAFFVAFIPFVTGVILIIKSQSSVDRDSEAVAREIDAMTADASFDLSEQIIVWDKLMFAQGIDTALEGREKVITDIYRRLVNARDEISAAQTTMHKIEAVLAADSILATSRAVI